MTFLVVSPLFEKADLLLEQRTGIPTPIFTAAGICFVLAHIGVVLSARLDRLPGEAYGIALWLYLLGAATAILLIVARGDAVEALRTYSHFVFFVVVALALCVSLDSAGVQYALRLVAAAATFSVIVGLVQVFDQNVATFGFTELLGLRSRSTSVYLRPVAFFSEPAYFGYFSLVGAAALVAVPARERTRRHRIASGTCLLGVVLPLSLGPLALAGASLLLVSVLGRGWSRIRWVVGAAAAAVVLAFSPLAGPVLARADRVLRALDPSTNVRFALNEVSLQLIREHPILGTGVGLSSPYFAAVRVPGVDFVAVHQAGNSYLAVAGEQGLPLALLLFGSIISIVVRRRDDSSVIRAVRGMTAVFLGSWFFVSSVGLPFFWVVIGLVLCALRNADERRDCSAPEADATGVRPVPAGAST